MGRRRPPNTPAADRTQKILCEMAEAMELGVTCPSPLAPSI